MPASPAQPQSSARVPEFPGNAERASRHFGGKAAIRRLGGLALAATSLVCPCHVLAASVAGAVFLATGQNLPITPAVQDGVHSVYLPLAVLGGTWLFSGR